jgi:hypothetical protein
MSGPADDAERCDGCGELEPFCECDEDAHGERFGFGVCRSGRCVEPCGDHGGCKR